MFYVRLFGFIQVERDSVPLDGFESEKALALLGYLALQRRPVARRLLAGLFWSLWRTAAPPIWPRRCASTAPT